MADPKSLLVALSSTMKNAGDGSLFDMKQAGDRREALDGQNASTDAKAITKIVNFMVPPWCPEMNQNVWSNESGKNTYNNICPYANKISPWEDQGVVTKKEKNYHTIHSRVPSVTLHEKIAKLKYRTVNNFVVEKKGT